MKKKEVLRLIDERIIWQKHLIKKQPIDKKLYEWRIIGFEELKERIEELK